MFAAGPFGGEHDPADDERGGSDGDDYGRTDNLVVALAHGTIGVCGAIGVEVGQLKRGAEYEKNGDEDAQKSPRARGNRPDCGVLSHT